jgi:hypothetical protein
MAPESQYPGFQAECWWLDFVARTPLGTKIRRAMAESASDNLLILCQTLSGPCVHEV